MTSHVDYIADQDVGQLNHLIEVAQKRLDDLTQGGWVWVWVVGTNTNKGWFHENDYGKAVAFLECLGNKSVSDGSRKDLFLERQQYRPAEARRLIDETKSAYMT